MPEVPKTISRRRGVLALAALSTLAAAALGVAEWQARVALREQADAARDRLPASALRSARFAGPMLAADEDLLWRNRPSLDRSIPEGGPLGRAWRLQTDDRGYRVTPRPRADRKPPFRILCLGDSLTFGVGVDDDEAWPARLAAELSGRFPDHAIEVVNAAVPGWSWVQGEAWLLHEGFALQPDLVIAAHGAADRELADRLTDSESLWVRGMLRPPAETGPALLALRSGRSGPASAPSIKSPGCRLQEVSAERCRRVGLTETAAVVYRIADSTRTVGAGLVVLGIDPGGAPGMEAARMAAVRSGASVVDVAGDLRREKVAADMKRAGGLGLALPRVPLVPFGAIGIPAPEGRGPRVRLRVAGVEASAAVTVEGRSDDESGFAVEASMNDEGRDGDEKAGDGIFSAVVELAPRGSTLLYRYTADGRAEFPSAAQADSAWRELRFNRDSDAPIDDFSGRPGKLDALHPDADGHGGIALRMADFLETDESFRRFAGLGAAATENGR